MPTIDQLDPVVVASDDDTLPVSQGGATRRVTRSQLLAGMQSTLALTQGLLGRASAALGPPQQIRIGNGLLLSDGVLSGTPPYSVAALPRSSTVTLGDLVPVLQQGQDRSVDVGTLLSTGNVDVSAHVARARFGTLRNVTDWLSDAIAVEAFGAVGDGVTDDTDALSRAIATGRPVLLGPKTYRVDGQWNVQMPATLLGTPGSTKLQRTSQIGGAWINISGSSIVCSNVIFDCGSLRGESWGVLVQPSCTHTSFWRCSFRNATGSSLGTGLTIQARDGVTGVGSSHSVVDCDFEGNEHHGLWIQAACGAVVDGCSATRNGKFGLCLDFNDPAFQQQVRLSSVSNCRCSNNSRGISIGNYNETNQEPPRWGLANPDAVDVSVVSNICDGNSSYGIAVSGKGIQVLQNRILISDLSNGASGILCNASDTLVSGNRIVGPGQYGIDAGGCSNVELHANTIENCQVGINPGGSLSVRIYENKLFENQRAITIFQIETDGQCSNFGIACKDVTVLFNEIQLATDGEGLVLVDGPQNVTVANNRFVSKYVSSFRAMCRAYTDTVSFERNTWNGAKTVVTSLQPSGAAAVNCVIVPDYLDYADLDPNLARVDAIRGLLEADLLGVITFVKVQSGGTGYTRAEVVIAGIGTGAAATAYVRDGAVVGIAMVDGGRDYAATSTQVTIVGDGQGCIAVPFVGLPRNAGRTLTIRCERKSTFPFDASLGQTNWTLADLTIPAGTDVVWEMSDTGWRAIRFAAVDYLEPAADGSVSLRSHVGDIRLQPGPGGAVRFYSSVESVGFTTQSGRGSPENVVSAPPGSDYRNLDGGAGETLWIKQSGTSAQGWFAVA